MVIHWVWGGLYFVGVAWFALWLGFRLWHNSGATGDVPLGFWGLGIALGLLTGVSAALCTVSQWWLVCLAVVAGGSAIVINMALAGRVNKLDEWALLAAVTVIAYLAFGANAVFHASALAHTVLVLVGIAVAMRLLEAFVAVLLGGNSPTPTTDERRGRAVVRVLALVAALVVVIISWPAIAAEDASVSAARAVANVAAEPQPTATAEPLPTATAAPLPTATVEPRPVPTATTKVVVVPTVTATAAVKNPAAGLNAGRNDTATMSPANAGWHFYNWDMLKNASPSDDFNFGPCPSGTNAEALKAEHFSRMWEDPALFAATMGVFDAAFGGTDLMEPGVFYNPSATSGEWTARMNERIRWLAQHPVEYAAVVDRALGFLGQRLANGQAQVNIYHVTSGLEDQMFMVTIAEGEIPEVIVAKTKQGGWVLCYEFSIKGNPVRVLFRCDCGFQPTNVAATVNAVVQENPIDPTPTATPAAGGKDPAATVAAKDPTKGIQTNGTQGGVKNDVPGPGPSTNNGVGATTSTEDLPTNSGNIQSTDTQTAYEIYQERTKDLKEVNKTQQVGGDPNTPSYTPPQTTTTTTTTTVHVDSNADNGTGNGGIDAPTPVQEPVHVVVKEEVTTTSQSQSISGDPPGSEWGGPPD